MTVAELIKGLAKIKDKEAQVYPVGSGLGIFHEKDGGLCDEYFDLDD